MLATMNNIYAIYFSISQLFKNYSIIAIVIKNIIEAIYIYIYLSIDRRNQIN